MPECSLCAGPLPPEGGAVLFTDARGIPFEVCLNCEEKIDLLRGSADEAEAGRALEYISECARNLGRRDVYDSLAEFIQRARPAEPEGQEDGAMEGKPDAGSDPFSDGGAGAYDTGSGGKAAKLKPFLLGILLIVILVLVFVLGGFPIR